MTDYLLIHALAGAGRACVACWRLERTRCSRRR